MSFKTCRVSKFRACLAGDEEDPLRLSLVRTQVLLEHGVRNGLKPVGIVHDVGALQALPDAVHHEHQVLHGDLAKK